jgi:hypothetical protein
MSHVLTDYYGAIVDEPEPRLIESPPRRNLLLSHAESSNEYAQVFNHDLQEDISLEKIIKALQEQLNLHESYLEKKAIIEKLQDKIGKENAQTIASQLMPADLKEFLWLDQKGELDPIIHAIKSKTTAGTLPSASNVPLVQPEKGKLVGFMLFLLQLFASIRTQKQELNVYDTETEKKIARNKVKNKRGFKGN